MKSYSEIKQNIKRGDVEVAAKMLKITQTNAHKALTREGSKYHERLLNALCKVVEMREMLIQEAASC